MYFIKIFSGSHNNLDVPIFFSAQENISTLQEPFDMEELMGVTQQLEENVTSTAAIGENINISNADFIEYDKCVQKIINEQEEIISLQDDIVSTGGNLGGLLSLYLKEIP